MRKPVVALEISEGQREVLEALARSQSGAHREVVRAKALLTAADGAANTAVARALSVSPASVANWRTRFAEDGVAKLGEVRKGRGRKPSIPQETIETIIDLTQNYRPQGQTHWSCRTMAQAVGVSKDTVQRVWSARELKPHRIENVQAVQRSPLRRKAGRRCRFVSEPAGKGDRVVRQRKVSVQALDRTQASLPMIPGRAQTMTHDYKRHGTTTLFAALDVHTGTVIGQCLPRHRHQEFLKILRTIDREVPKDLTIHLILDNYAARKHPTAGAWLDKRPRFQLHFHPDLLVVAQPRRTLVPRTHRQSVAARGISFRAPPDRLDRGIPRRAQRRSPPLRVDRDRRSHPRQSRPRTHRPRKVS